MDYYYYYYILEVQEAVCSTKCLTKERSFVGVTDKYARLVTVSFALAHEAHCKVSVNRELDTGLRAHAVDDGASCDCFHVS